MPRYSSTPSADAAVAVLTDALRGLLARPDLSHDQQRALAQCLVVLLEFPRIDETYCVHIRIGPRTLETVDGTLALGLSIGIEPGFIEACIDGSFRDAERGMHDSITTCELTATDDTADYEDYRHVHASVADVADLPALDAVSLRLLQLDSLAPLMEVDLPADQSDDD